MSYYGLDANITGKLTIPATQWFWWYSATTTPSWSGEGVIPANLYSLSTAASPGTALAPASSVLTADAGGLALIVFPVKGKYTISFTAPFINTATNNMAWWTVNTGYDAVGNTNLARYNIGWMSPPNGFATTVIFSGIFNAGDKVYPTCYSSTTTSLGTNTGQRFSLSVVLEYRCP